jgi:hypothetical protein
MPMDIGMQTIQMAVGYIILVLMPVNQYLLTVKAISLHLMPTEVDYT